MRDIVEWAQSAEGFYVDRHWRNGRWVLEPGPIRLAPYHADLLRHCFTPREDGRLPYDVIAICEPAKSGKSAIAGLCAEYMALHGDTNSQVIMASNKQNQAASVMFKSAADSVSLCPALPNVDPTRYKIEFANGNTIEAIPSNAKGAAGARFSLATFDELWGAIHTDAQRLWSEHKTDPTRLHSLKLAVGYAGYVSESVLWEEVLQSGKAGQPVPELAHITNSDGSPACWSNGRHFTFWSDTCRQPWQTAEWIAEQRRSLREPEFRRMVRCEFAEGTGDFVDQDVWESLVDPEHKPLEPGSEHPVYVGLDVATKVGGDDCAVVAVYSDGDLVKVAWHKIWGGKSRRQDLRLSESVQPYLLGMKQQYHIAGVYFDPFQALQLAENLRRAGLRCNEVAQTHATRGPRDTALFDLAINRRLVLYDDPELRNAASFASAKELGNGLLFLQKSGRGTIDLLVSLSNCCFAAMQPRGVFCVVLDHSVPSQEQREPAQIESQASADLARHEEHWRRWQLGD